MVTRMCALYVEKIRKVYRRFISLEGAFMKMVLKIAEFLTLKDHNSGKLRCLTYFYFFIIMVTRMCALHVEKIRKVYRRFISLEGAFMKMVLKIAKFLTLKDHNSGKLRCLTYFYFFIIMVTRMCALHVEKIRKVYRRFISLEGAFRKMVLKIAEFLT